MIAAPPHYLLYAESRPQMAPGHWRFILRGDKGRVLFEVADAEPGVSGQRAELLAVVRGLEALDRPARVTLVTSSSYVARGLAYGLEAWRETGWTWEWFGRMVPVKNRDLWQRLDRALEFHDVKCRRWRIDGPHELPARAVEAPTIAPQEAADAGVVRTNSRRGPKSGVPGAGAGCEAPDDALGHAALCPRHPIESKKTQQDEFAILLRTKSRRWRRRRLATWQWAAQQAETWRLRLAQLGTSLLPKPWLG